MADRESSVRFKAISDFANLNRSLRTTARNIAAVRKEEERLNATTAAGETRSAQAVGKHAKARVELTDAIDDETSAVQKSTREFVSNAAAAREKVRFTKEAARASEDLAKATDAGQATTRRARIEQEKLAAGLGKTEQMTRRQRREIERQQATMAQANKGVTKFHQGLMKLQNWRPRLTPPFIVLIPAIAGVLGLINPLVAGLGALGMAGFALASSLGSVVSVLAVGIIPALATTIGLVAALKTAFGGIGEAFKAASAMRDVAGGGGGGSKKQEISDAEKLARAQEDLARATQDVAFAQEDLDDARKGYIERLKALQKAVDRAALSEARAAANSQLARENYANVLADPGSTKGQKMDAQVGVGEAQADYQDVIDQNIKNQAELLEMQQKGIEGDREVIMATRALTDAMNRQRDAQIELANEQSGANKAMAGGASAAAEYQRMLAKLSPSARKFVETIVGLQEAWDAMGRSVQESFFGEVADDLGLIQKYIAPLEKMLGSIAGAAGRVFSKFLKLTTSSEWLEDLVLFGELAAPVVETIGDGLLSLIDSFRNLTIAAMPFLQALADGFAEGAKNFSIFIEEGRKSGAIASWLEEGRQRLAQWWRIIKNIGATLFNYGRAAAPFADWLTSALEKSTEGWRKNSEAAMEAGSPFQTYLENLKPLLSEIGGLIGDFFSWFSEEAMDPKNIEQMTEIFKTLREDVGPSLAKAFDALSGAEIGPKIIDTLGKLIEFVATVLENGGADALAGFFDTLVGLLDALIAFASSPGGGAVIVTLGTVLAGLAALTFVGQFTGLTNLLGFLITFAGNKGAMSVLTSLGSLAKGGLGKIGGALGLTKGGGLLKAAGGAAAVGTSAVYGTQSLAGAAGTASVALPDLIDMIKNPRVTGNKEKDAEAVLDRGQMWQKELNMSNPIALIAKDLTNLFGGDGESVQESIATFFSDLNRGFTDWLIDSGENLGKFWFDVTKNVGNWWNGLVANVSMWWSGITSAVSTAWTNITTAVSTAWATITTAVSTAWTNAMLGIEGIVSGIRGVINAIITFLNSIFGTKIPTMGAPKGASGKGDKKNRGGILRRSGGGDVPGTGNQDTVPAMLTPGEVVLNRAVVQHMGPDIADAFGRGLISFGDALQMSMARSGGSKPKGGSGFSGLSFFASGGLAGGGDGGGFSGGAGGGLPPSTFSGAPGAGGTTMNFGDIHVHNPVAERTSDSLPRTVRGLSYVGGRK